MLEFWIFICCLLWGKKNQVQYSVPAYYYNCLFKGTFTTTTTTTTTTTAIFKASQLHWHTVLEQITTGPRDAAEATDDNNWPGYYLTNF